MRDERGGERRAERGERGRASKAPHRGRVRPLADQQDGQPRRGVATVGQHELVHLGPHRGADAGAYRLAVEHGRGGHAPCLRPRNRPRHGQLRSHQRANQPADRVRGACSSLPSAGHAAGGGSTLECGAALSPAPGPWQQGRRPRSRAVWQRSCAGMRGALCSGAAVLSADRRPKGGGAGCVPATSRMLGGTGTSKTARPRQAAAR